MKIAGRFISGDSDAVEDVVEISLTDGEVTLGTNDSNTIIMIQKSDLERVLSEIEDTEPEE